ncbi:MAG: TIGR04283 family arsenosugar biosynthesis glycosyltransferase [Vicinamibacterales bacterium]
MLVSIVIPVKQDGPALARLLGGLKPLPAGAEVIVSAADEVEDGDAPDRGAWPWVRWTVGPAGRGPQLNRGARLAAGQWIWFLHADSEPPAHWFEEFRALEAAPEVVGGSFRFALASRAWQARWLERGVACRVRLFGLPYGDQGIFARRGVFEEMGGFAPLPLMEDVEFVRRLRGRGRLRHLDTPLVTSARRWEREGWVRRSAANLLTLGLYDIGASPAWLARRYDRRRTGP